MDVSIIMINYNTLELTKKVIDSILLQTQNLNYEIILVDNNSTDGSKEYFSNNKIEKLKFIENSENLGFGKANNIGYSHAKGKYIFLLNTDTILLNNAIKILHDILVKNVSIGIVGGNLYDEDMNPTHSYGNKIYNTLTDIKSEIKDIIKIILKNERLKKKRNDFNYSNEIIEVGYITGADMMIKRECIEKVGFFDPDFFMYFEETELTVRIKKAGYKVVSSPQAKIIHLEGRSTKFKEQKIRMFNESKFKYFEKVYGKKKQLLVYYISQFSNYIKFLLSFNRNYLRVIKINKEIKNNIIINLKNKNY